MDGKERNGWKEEGMESGSGAVAVQVWAIILNEAILYAGFPLALSPVINFNTQLTVRGYVISDAARASHEIWSRSSMPRLFVWNRPVPPEIATRPSFSDFRNIFNDFTGRNAGFMATAHRTDNPVQIAVRIDSQHEYPAETVCRAPLFTITPAWHGSSTVPLNIQRSSPPDVDLQRSLLILSVNYAGGYHWYSSRLDMT